MTVAEKNTAGDPQAATLSTAASGGIQLIAPPFYGNWQRFRTPEQPGSWTAVRTNWHGRVVAQLGSEPPAGQNGPVAAHLIAGYQRFQQVDGGHHDWIAEVDPVSWSERPHYLADTFAFLEVRGSSHPNYVRFVPLRDRRLYLTAGASTFGRPIPAGRYRIRVGVFDFIRYEPGQQAYAEGIADILRVYHRSPLVTAAATLAQEEGGTDAATAEQLLQQALDRDDLLVEDPPDVDTDLQTLRAMDA